MTDPSSNVVTLRRTGIAWPGDIESWVNSPDLSTQAFDVTEEDWLVWFRPAARRDFYKLYGAVETDMAAGNYTVTFDNGTFTFMLSLCL